MRIKICGMKRQRDLDLAAELGFHYCGFIFHAESPRNIDPQIAGALKSGPMGRVGVFVNQRSREILQIMRMAKLDYAQLHGPQTIKDAREIGIDRVIRVLWPDTGTDTLAELTRQWADACQYFLIDSGSSGGGSGKTCDTAFLKKTHFQKPWFLAGGISADNIKNMLACAQPYAVDVNSGVEDEPGCKNHGEMKRLFQLSMEFGV